MRVHSAHFAKEKRVGITRPRKAKRAYVGGRGKTCPGGHTAC